MLIVILNVILSPMTVPAGNASAANGPVNEATKPVFPKKPVVLTIDGICFTATTSIVQNEACWTDYLKGAFSSNLEDDYAVASFQWTGDPKETSNVLPDAEKTIRGFYEVAKRRGQPFQIIAHSWGSVLAYIVLKKNSDIKVETFITLGSPLKSQGGIVVERYTSGYAGATILKPANVRRWVNYWAWNDLISGLIDVADKNFQLDGQDPRTDDETRLMATLAFHSQYYTAWKSPIIADLSRPVTAEIVISTIKGFPIAYYSGNQYHEISFSSMMSEREATAQDLQYRSILNRITQLSIISGGQKVGDYKVDHVAFGHVMGCENRFNFISATQRPPLTFVPDQFLLSGNFNETNKFIKLKSIPPGVTSALQGAAKRELRSSKATHPANIDMSSLKIQYLNAYDTNADQTLDFFIMSVEAKLFKPEGREDVGSIYAINLFMVVIQAGSQYKVLYIDEPLYNEASLIGAADIDGDGNMEIVITTGHGESFDFEIWRFENGNLRQVYSGTPYGC